MEESSTKVLLKKKPSLPPNRILPQEIDYDYALSQSGPESELPDVNEIKGTLRSEQAPPEKETFTPN